MLRPGELAPVEDPDTHRRSWRRWRGYRSAAERFAKTRRLAVLRARLATAGEALAAGRPSITVGGKRLWRTRNHLEITDMTDQQWRDRWDGARMFLTADGESGKAGGNETIRVDEAGRLRIKVPAKLVDAVRYPPGDRRAGAVQPPPRRVERAREHATSGALRHQLRPRPGALVSGRVLENRRPDQYPSSTNCVPGGSWVWTSMPTIWPRVCSTRRATRSVNPSPSPSKPRGCEHRGAMGGYARPSPRCSTTPTSRTARRSWWRTSTSPTRAPQAGKPSGAAQRGKRLRRTVAGIPTRKFRTRLTGMANRRGIAIIGVDPAYTSRWGAQHWREPFQQQTSDPATVTAHHAAAAAIGRRGLGLAIRRRPAGPRTRQRTSVGTSPARPDAEPSTTPRRCRSSGSPPRPPPTRRAGPSDNTHRQRPIPFGPHRTHSCSVIRNGLPPPVVLGGPLIIGQCLVAVQIVMIGSARQLLL